jgi:hypothetical protein
MKQLIMASLALALVAPVVIMLSGCPAQNTTAALVTVLGNAASTIATLEGNTTLAATLKTDTAAASSAVLNWKSGTPTQDVIAALNLVEADLDLVPSVGPYVPLIDLAIGTVESIMEIIQPGSSTPNGLTQRLGVSRRVYLAKPPKDAAAFTKSWNAIVAQNPALAGAKL